MRTILETDREFICDIQAPCFQNLLPEEAKLVRSSKTQVLFRKGDNLTKQGAFASYVLFIINGLAKQYLEGDNTKNYNLRIIRPGEFVGLSVVFHENIFNYSSVALQTSGNKSAEIGSEVKTLVNMMNAMYFIGQSNSDCVQHWWLRQGSSDNHTSQTVIANLATSLENRNKVVNTLLYWDAGHGADQDPEDFIAWIGNVTGLSKHSNAGN